MLSWKCLGWASSELAVLLWGGDCPFLALTSCLSLWLLQRAHFPFPLGQLLKIFKVSGSLFSRRFCIGVGLSTSCSGGHASLPIHLPVYLFCNSDRICPNKLEMKSPNQTQVSAVLPGLQICWDVKGVLGILLSRRCQKI